MNTSALEAVRREASELEEALIYLQELDHAYTKYYARVYKRYRITLKALKKLEKASKILI